LLSGGVNSKGLIESAFIEREEAFVNRDFFLKPLRVNGPHFEKVDPCGLEGS